MDPILNQLIFKIKEAAVHRVRSGLVQMGVGPDEVSRENREVMVQAEIQRIINQIVAGAK